MVDTAGTAILPREYPVSGALSSTRNGRDGCETEAAGRKGPVRHRRRTIGRRAILFDRPLAGRDATVARITIFLC